MADTVLVDFKDSVNLAGVEPVDVMFQDPPGGAYEVAVQTMRKVTKEGGKTSYRFGLGIVEDGPGKGIQTQAVIGTDWSKAFNLSHLMNALRGLHTPDGKYANPEQLKAGLDVSPALFVGKRAFILVKPAPAGEIDDLGRPALADKNFITREMYEQAKKLGTIPTARAASGGNAAGATPPVPTAAPAPGAQPTALKDIFGS